MDSDLKTDLLLAVTASVQHSQSLDLKKSNSYIWQLTSQALLVETPACTAQQHAKWAKAAQELLMTLLAEMSGAEVRNMRHNS